MCKSNEHDFFVQVNINLIEKVKDNKIATTIDFTYKLNSKY